MSSSNNAFRSTFFAFLGLEGFFGSGCTLLLFATGASFCSASAGSSASCVSSSAVSTEVSSAESVAAASSSASSVTAASASSEVSSTAGASSCAVSSCTVSSSAICSSSCGVVCSSTGCASGSCFVSTFFAVSASSLDPALCTVSFFFFTAESLCRSDASSPSKLNSVASSPIKMSLLIVICATSAEPKYSFRTGTCSIAFTGSSDLIIVKNTANGLI